MYRASFNECGPLAGGYLAQTCGEGHPAQRAVAQRGQRVVVFFHQQHVLEGRSMEDHFRFGPTESVAQVRQVFHITDHPIQWQGRTALAQVLLDGVGVELAQPVQHQPDELEARHLAAQLTADAAAAHAETNQV